MRRWTSPVIDTAAIFLIVMAAKTAIAEPYYVPSGSMEPTLIGHEDFGDRILTNKLAYVSPAAAWLAAGAFLFLCLQGMIWAIDYYRGESASSRIPFIATLCLVGLRFWRSFHSNYYIPAFDWIGLAAFAGVAAHTVYWLARNFRESFKYRGPVKWAVIFLVLTVGGIFYAWSRDAVAAEPKRFDVVVFEYSEGWADGPSKNRDINYIKRLTGLPGDRIMISGGDLFLYDKKASRYQIIRKWKEHGDGTQNDLWFPVSKAFEPRFNDPNLPDEKDEAIVKQQIRDLVFPWSGAEDGKPGVKLEDKALALDGSVPVTLEFKFPVKNIYLKQGRWPFKHLGCPAANLPPVESGGILWRNPKSEKEDMDAMVSNTWDGIQCPNCRRIYYPLMVGPNSDGTTLLAQEGATKYFYGGNHSVGDLKIDLKLNVEAFGSMRLECGNNLRRAVWDIPGGGEKDADGSNGMENYVQSKTDALAPGEHTLSLAYVDATVIAVLDGEEIERRELDVQPVTETASNKSTTVAKITFTGVKGRVPSLNLSRDLFYTSKLQASDKAYDDSRMYDRAKHEGHHYDEETGNLVMNVKEGEYLMMGDNSPSSSDGRVWGFVPRERLMGRAWIVGWPLSRFKVIR